MLSSAQWNRVCAALTAAGYREIGAPISGGMGVVVQVRQPAVDGLETAVKLLLPPDNENEVLVTRFEQEARIGLLIAPHPNLRRVFGTSELEVDFGTNHSRQFVRIPFVKLEWIAGSNLEAFLHNSGGRLEPATALRIIAQVARGAAHMHNLGIIHRDLKPKNFLLDDSKKATRAWIKLADFGISKIVRGTHRSPQLTRQPSNLGTREYMAPEQLLGEDADEASDTFSLALIAYELLIGSRPYDENERKRLGHGEQIPPPPLPPDVPEPVVATLQAALCGKRGGRPPIKAVADAIEVGAQPTVAIPVAVGTNRPVAQRQKVRWSGVGLAGLGTLLVPAVLVAHGIVGFEQPLLQLGLKIAVSLVVAGLVHLLAKGRPLWSLVTGVFCFFLFESLFHVPPLIAWRRTNEFADAVRSVARDDDCVEVLPLVNDNDFAATDYVDGLIRQRLGKTTDLTIVPLHTAAGRPAGCRMRLKGQVYARVGKRSLPFAGVVELDERNQGTWQTVAYLPFGDTSRLRQAARIVSEVSFDSTSAYLTKLGKFHRAAGRTRTDGRCIEYNMEGWRRSAERDAVAALVDEIGATTLVHVVRRTVIETGPNDFAAEIVVFPSATGAEAASLSPSCARHGF